MSLFVGDGEQMMWDQNEPPPPYHELNEPEKHYITDKVLRECLAGSVFGVVLLLIALVVAIVFLVKTESPPKIQPIYELVFLGTDLNSWNSSLSTVPCCTVFNSQALCIGLSLGARSFCNAVMPACIPPNANGANMDLPNFITSTGVALPTFSVHGAFYGNRSYVNSYDSGNTYGLPYEWISLPILVNDVITVTNYDELYFNLILDDIDTQIPIIQNGILASDGFIMNCQNAVPNFRVLTIKESNPSQIEFDGD